MNKKILLSLSTIALLTSANGTEFKPVGFKAVGMGGAGVASTRGSLSGYYNPALLQMSDSTTEISINGGASVSETNLIDNMEELEDIDISGSFDTIGQNIENKNVRITAESDGTNYTLSNGGSIPVAGLNDGDPQTIDGRIYTAKINNGTLTLEATGTSNTQTIRDNMTKALDLVTNKLGQGAANVSGYGSLSIQASDAVAIGAYVNADFSMKMKFSKDHNKLLVKDGTNYYEYDPTTDFYTLSTGTEAQSNYESSSLEYGLENENSIEVQGSLLTEIPISYAKAYDWDKSGYWSFGLNIKPMTFESTQSTIDFGENQDDAEDKDDNTDTTEYKSTFGLDLGVAFKPKAYDMTVGLMIKNINSPKFKVDTDPSGLATDVAMDPMARIGISVPIWNDNIEFAFDADLTKNKTLLGDESQFIGGGVEFHPASWFALRAGAMQDNGVQTFDYGTIMTAGLGVGLKWLQMDLSLAQSSEKGSYDGEEIPRYTALNFSIVSKWGDGYNTKTPPKKEELPASKLLNESEKNKINSDAQKAQDELNKTI
jgi:hypothetical protein